MSAPSAGVVAAPGSRRDDVGVWVFRLVWLALPFTEGPALGQALDPHSTGVRAVATVLAWSIWATTLAASLVPRDASLTVIRVAAPAAPVAAGWAALSGETGAVAAVVAVVTGLLAAAAALAPVTADAFVNGSSYGPERRLTLRVPGRLLLVAPVTWAMTAAGLVLGPLLLGARSWIAGGLALVVGWPIAALGVRALHGLSRRWVVFVPAGLVLHDLIGLTDNLLLPRSMIRALGPAPATTGALDLTQRSPGLALQVDLTEPISIGVRVGRRAADNVEAGSLLFTPARPGAVLSTAATRRISVGQPAAIPPPATSSPS